MAKKIEQLNVFFTPESFILENLSTEESETIEKWKIDYDLNKYQWLFKISFREKSPLFSPTLCFIHHLSDILIKKITQRPDLELNRENIDLEFSEEEKEEVLESLPFAVGMDYVTSDWLDRQWAELLTVFKEEIKSFDGSVNRYFSEYRDDINLVGRVFFHLVESKNEDYPFAFMATYSSKALKSSRAIHTPLKNALKEYENDEKKLITLISTVMKASEKSDFILELLESGDLFSPIKLNQEEAYIFLKEIPIYEASGIKCRVPNWWRKKSKNLQLSVSVGEKTPSQVGINALMDFKPFLSLDGEEITEEALKEFLLMSEGLMQYKGKWIEINQQRLQALLKALEEVKENIDSEGLTVAEAIGLQLNGLDHLELSDTDMDITISNGQWLKSIRKDLLSPESIEKIQLPNKFSATLRHYQEAGYQWLNKMSTLGFGACLADDMGLGKTIQVIALLSYIKENTHSSVLLVLPASLIANWQSEIEKFAPELPYKVFHSSQMKKGEAFEIKEEDFLIITTYGMAKKIEALKEKKWDFLILDEAQAIKNPGTKQTKAIKDIPAKMRIALTGTPIENKLGDLWSLFDFLNKGLLGSPKEFTRFTKELADHAQGYLKLRKMIQPFILRRMKTDKSIISDLPDKIEMNAYTTLSKKQIVLYKTLIKSLEKSLETSEGIQRKGLVLSSLMKFKQICNHPDQYIGASDFKAADSGKFMRLKEICETIYEKRERVLIFTQFREMTEPLSAFLKEIFLKEGLVLHGGTSVKKRQEMVDVFNSEAYMPYMVLSLKAGGVGLNLTGANHVIHFDRWWNPAVENQATDRAFRINQKKNVMVHKFVTKGTIEEKIDLMIQEKQKLSGELLSSGGEQWLTEYSTDQLLELFALGGD